MHYYKKDYPRPQLVRENFTLLDGEWDFAFDRPEFTGTKIRVPFTFETGLSGIGDETPHNSVWYKKEVKVSKPADGKRLILHFEGVDHEAFVYVNGKMIGSHKGGYSRFSFDITEYITEGLNEIKVNATDELDPAMPRGKQRWIEENFGCWYVQTTGIWKSVWMEEVGDTYVKELKITPDRDNGCAFVSVGTNLPAKDGGLRAKAKVYFEGKEVTSLESDITKEADTLRLSLFNTRICEWGLREWAPDHPDLYDVEIELVKDGKSVDKVYSYFGLRDIRIDGDKVLLNGEPLYQRLILDQGYFKDSHLTPPSEEALIKDIDSILALGYNGVRKHQKTEDERFLYWCDVKGVLVWSEMAAAYTFSDEAVSEFTKEWIEIVRQNYSHPCIVTWTPFNESWGIREVKRDRRQQAFTESIYHLTKAIDPMRPVIVNDGWEHTVSDIITLHDYEEKGEVLYKRYTEYKDDILSNRVYHSKFRSAFAYGYKYDGKPVIISEFGGIAFNEEGGWGYGNKVANEEDFLKRFDSITTAIKKLDYVCGYCYTQVSDVQQEINGLLTEDRRFKIDPAKIKEINIREV
ncbi:MAG: glycoside hydrolase family 2 [Lachnospiraceae bacterium]|nr:glycoside hydrolase family 2 [Lachnospiraceae bacterium]